MTPDELKQWQKTRGWNNSELASALGASLRTVGRWRSGESAIPPYLPLALESLDT